MEDMMEDGHVVTLQIVGEMIGTYVYLSVIVEMQTFGHATFSPRNFDK